MVTITMSAAGAKNAANRLREFMAVDGITLKQTRAYEAIAQVLGYANWNTLQAVLSDKASSEIAENRAAAHMVDARGRVYTVERLAEQAAPRIAIPFDPPKFDKFVGCYQFDPDVSPDEWLIVTRKGDQFLTRCRDKKRPSRLTRKARPSSSQ
jgi:hypothetical protein